MTKACKHTQFERIVNALLTRPEGMTYLQMMTDLHVLCPWKRIEENTLGNLDFLHRAKSGKVSIYKFDKRHRDDRVVVVRLVRVPKLVF